MNQHRMPNHAVAGGAWIRVAQLSIPALLAVYASIMLGEFVAGAGLASRLFGDMSFPISLIIHTLITLPVAFVVGYALVRWGPDSGRKAVTVVVLLWSTLIVVLQLAVYEPRVVELSALKVLFVVAPLLTGSWIAHRVLTRRLRG